MIVFYNSHTHITSFKTDEKVPKLEQHGTSQKLRIAINNRIKSFKITYFDYFRLAYSKMCAIFALFMFFGDFRSKIKQNLEVFST